MHFYTIGHSARSLEEFIELLHENGVWILVDVRRWPSSSRHPHFSKMNMSEALKEHGVMYEWLGKQLGGYRKKGLEEESPSKGWSSRGFRNYADHTLTEEFREGIRRLLELAEKETVALMCAERLYWRCHRRIISDYLVVKGHSVTHILEKGKTEEHRLTSFAEVVNGELRYPGRMERQHLAQSPERALPI
ncbi:DUF488 domain-containing protein [Candidatus Bathyarchaeota archaeon]|nr:DUF488 domain-containing protein [Candidatus Bathyarchaeota archaeon]